jgi:protein gp37
MPAEALPLNEQLAGPIYIDALRGVKSLGWRGLDQVIAGGQSGPGAAPAHPDWFRRTRDDCVDAGVAFFFKQWGEWAPHQVRAGGDLGGEVRAGRVRIVHPTGQSDIKVAEATGGRSTIPGSRYMARVGKKAAGRLLDGRTWDEQPGGSEAA